MTKPDHEAAKFTAKWLAEGIGPGGSPLRGAKLEELAHAYLDAIARAQAAEALQGILTEDRDHWRDRAQAAELKCAQLEERIADYDFGDSDRLRLLRDAIDDNLPWRDQEAEDNGDYIECVTLAGERLRAAERSGGGWSCSFAGVDLPKQTGSFDEAEAETIRLARRVLTEALAALPEESSNG